MKIQTLMIAILFASQPVFSQQEAKTLKTSSPDWVCEDGFWVVESNVKDKKNHILYFYNNFNQLIGQREIVGEKFKPHKTKNRRLLKKELESKLQVWASAQIKQP